MSALLHPICAVIALAGLIYKINDLRKNPRNPALIALCLVYFFSAASFIISIPTVWMRIDAFTGVPNIVVVIAHSCVILLVTGEQILLTLWIHPQGNARAAASVRAFICVLVISTLLALFILMDADRERPFDFGAYYAKNPYYDLYILFYTTSYALAEIRVGRLCWQHARNADRLWLRRGLRMVAIGAWITLGFSIVRTADIAGSNLGLNVENWDSVAWLCGDTGAALKLVGWTIPGWIPLAAAGAQFVKNYRYYRGLYPLWLSLYKSTPEIALYPPLSPWKERFTTRDLEFRLNRRIIEIRDGQRSLRPYMKPGVTVAAFRYAELMGFSGDKRLAFIEAAQIDAAMLDKMSNGLISPPVSENISGHYRKPEIKEEMRWLLAVSREREISSFQLMDTSNEAPPCLL
jgi:hypothetical protein